MKNFIVASFISFSAAASANEAYLLVCKGEEVSFSLKKDMELIDETNGWKNYWAVVDYKASDKMGTLNAWVAWRIDPRPDYKVFAAHPMDKSESEFRKLGYEGGSVGFGGIYSRVDIAGKFKAVWKVHKTSEDAPELTLENEIELDCEAK